MTINYIVLLIWLASILLCFAINIIWVKLGKHTRQGFKSGMTISFVPIVNIIMHLIVTYLIIYDEYDFFGSVYDKLTKRK